MPACASETAMRAIQPRVQRLHIVLVAAAPPPAALAGAAPLAGSHAAAPAGHACHIPPVCSLNGAHPHCGLHSSGTYGRNGCTVCSSCTRLQLGKLLGGLLLICSSAATAVAVAALLLLSPTPVTPLHDKPQQPPLG